MKIVDMFTITGRGTALLTDQFFKDGDFRLLKGKRKLRVTTSAAVFDFEVKGVEAALKDGRDFLGFLVPEIEDQQIRDSIRGASAELR